MYLHGDPFEDRADQGHLSKDRAQSPTIDILHWDEVTEEEHQGVHDGDDGYSDGTEQNVETAGSAHLRASRSVGWCTDCALHSCWCSPPNDHDISPCSPFLQSQDFIHSLVC